MLCHGNPSMNSTSSTCYTQLPSMLLFAHIFLFMNKTFSHISINIFSIISFSFLFLPPNIRYSSPSLVHPLDPPWACSPCPMEVWKSFLPINGPLILHEPMRIENDFLTYGNYDENPYAQWNTREVPFSNQNRMIILMTNGIGGFIFSLILDILMGFLSSIIVNFVHSTLTSYFFILTILSN